MANKIPLPGGCSYTLIVNPSNWNKKNANPKMTWYIFYRFYEPGTNPCQVYIKGMNQMKSLEDKQEVTKALLQTVTQALESGYNPNKKKIIRSESSEISPNDTLDFALNFALEKRKLEHSTRIVIRSELKGFLKAATALNYNNLPIKEIRRKHIIAILEKCETLNSNFSASSYNHYRKDMSILFKELVRWEAIEMNPIDEFVEKRKEEKKIKKILDKEARKPLHTLKETNYSFYRFLICFYHSSRRITELVKIKYEDVDLKSQKGKVLMKKGRDKKWVEFTIENDALSYWEELISEALPGQYLFSKGLKPGPINIRADQIKRRWKTHVQEKLGIDVGIYSLKHSHLEAIAAEKGLQEAQKAAGHSTPVITMIYAVGEKEREHERRKEGAGTL